MGAFTNLDDAEIAALAARFDVGAVRSWRAIEAGTINSNFALETERGRYFLRINEGKSRDDVAWEAALVEALVAAGVPAPRPLKAGGEPFAEVRGKLASLFPWVDGEHRELGEVSPEDAAAVGAALATMHRAGGELASKLGRPSTYAMDRIIARYRGFAGSGDPELGPAIDALGAEIEWQAPRTNVRHAATQGLIHGDLFRDNVIFAGEELVALIDFEQASSGSLVYDLAVCLNAWCYLEDILPVQARAMIAGYQKVRPLTEDDRVALPVEVRSAAMRFCITRITDVYLPGYDKPEKDFRRYLRRLERWQELGPEPLRQWLC